MGTAINHPVPDRVKPSFALAIFDIRALWHPGLSIRVPGCHKLQIWLNLFWHRILYSCTHMATVGVKGLNIELLNILHRVDWQIFFDNICDCSVYWTVLLDATTAPVRCSQLGAGLRSFSAAQLFSRSTVVVDKVMANSQCHSAGSTAAHYISCKYYYYFLALQY